MGEEGRTPEIWGFGNLLTEKRKSIDNFFFLYCNCICLVLKHVKHANFRAK